jgi:hypothetical protein
MRLPAILAAAALLAVTALPMSAPSPVRAGDGVALVTYYDSSFADGCVYSSPHGRCDRPYWGSAAASWDIPVGTVIRVGGHVVTVTDRGLLGSGNPTHIDVYCDLPAADCERLFGYGMYPIEILAYGDEG